MPTQPPKPPPAPHVGLVRGRVIARDDRHLLVRTATGDVQIPRTGGAEAGDLICVGADGSEPEIVRTYLRGEYPNPDTEMGRMAGGRAERLRERSRALSAIRGFFEAREFVEVETPLLVRAPGLEVHLRAVPAGVGQWLITSPEYQMKRLLCGGMERIYTICKCFRDGERGGMHIPEFTMLEWYRAWAGWERILADTVELVGEVAAAVNGEPFVEVGGRRIDVSPPWLRMTVGDAMRRFAGVSLAGDEEPRRLAAALVAAGIDVGAARAWDDLFYTAFVDRVEPAIAEMDRPVILYDWPVQLAALARRKLSDPWVVERFEVYVGGVELCNAFGELTEPIEQRERFERDRDERMQRGLPPYPVDERFLDALEEGLPPCAGIALGVDRLVALVTGADDIAQVVAFTPDEV